MTKKKIVKKVRLPKELTAIKRENTIATKKHWTPKKAFFIVGAIAGVLALLARYVLENYAFQIIDLCNLIGINRKIVLLPLYTVPLLIPDLIDLFIGMAGIPVGLFFNSVMVFLFNAAVFGGIAAIYEKRGVRTPRKFWTIMACCAAFVVGIILLFMW